MSTMPVIDDHMVALFRRTGSRRGSYQPHRSNRTTRNGANVVLQGHVFCPVVGALCRHPNGALGFCHPDHICRQDPFPPDNHLP
jgi:hypothetical protein